ncbi:uncharacterized protein [Palaemon carinicauda]|uniref:uncharacterized protein n=1 Tax=Palaemon carinicauda TaxID=392227 RepID=UPI0035B5BABE
MTKVNTLMDNNFTTFKTSIKASTCPITSQSSDKVAHYPLANRSEIPTHGYKTLCVEFFANFCLLVDRAYQHLVNADSYSSTPLLPAPSSLTLYISIPQIPMPSSYHTRKSCDQNFTKRQQLPSNTAFISISIRSDPAVFARFKGLTSDCLATAKGTFTKMKEMGLCYKASKPWSSPIHIVLRKDDTLHPCEYFKCLNMHIERDPYLLFNIAVITSYLHKANVFSTLDFLKGYYQYDFLVLYNKCTFGANEISFLGHYITPEPDLFPKKVSVILASHRCYSCPSLCLPQGQAIRPKGVSPSRSDLQHNEYPHQMLLLSLFLCHMPLSFSPPIPVMSLLVQYSSKWSMAQPSFFAFFSRKQSKSKSSYFTFGRELLVVHFAVHRFHHFLDGTPFAIYTDYMPLMHTFTQQSHAWSARQCQHLSTNCTLQHVPGKISHIGDDLSRNTLAAIQLGLLYNALEEPQ